MSTVNTPQSLPMAGRRTAVCGPTHPATPPDGDPVSPVSRDKMGALARYGSLLPLVGGLLEINYGVKEMRLGITPQERTDGKVDIIRGASAMVGGAFTTPIYFATTPILIHTLGALPISHPVLAMMGLVGGLANTVNAVFDGGRDMVNGYKGLKTGDPHAKSDMAWGAVKLTSGLLVAAGSIFLSPAFLYAGNIVYGAAACIQNRKQILETVRHVSEGPSGFPVGRFVSACSRRRRPV